MDKRWLARFLSSVPGAIIDLNASRSLFLGMGILSASLSLAGIALAYFLYKGPQKAKDGSWNALLFHAFYLDEAYRYLLVRPYRWAAGFLWQRVDEQSLDKTLETFGISFESASMTMRLLTNGKLSTYLKAFLVGLLGILCLFISRSTLW